MRKILLLVKHDVGEAGMYIIAFIVQLCQKYFCLLVHCQGFIGSNGGCGNDHTAGGGRGCQSFCNSIILLWTVSEDVSLLITLKAFSLFDPPCFLIFGHGCLCP